MKKTKVYLETLLSVDSLSVFSQLLVSAFSSASESLVSVFSSEVLLSAGCFFLMQTVGL